MRCDDVIRELAVPSGEQNPAMLRDHLAACASCANWATHAGQLDRIWELTRPTEPSPEAWDAVWAQIASSLDSSTVTQVETFSLPMASVNGRASSLLKPVEPKLAVRERSRNWRALGVIGIAQAAAILLVISLTWHRSPEPIRPVVADVKAPSTAITATGSARGVGGFSSVPVVEIDEGRLVVIFTEGSAAKVVDLTPQAAASRLDRRLSNLESAGVDDWLLMLNEAESMTKPLVAMKE